MAQKNMEVIAKELFNIKNQNEGGRVGISYKPYEAKSFLDKYSYKKVGDYEFDSTDIIDAVTNELKRGKAVMVVANKDDLKYILYSMDW